MPDEPAPEIAAKRLAAYDRLIATLPGVERRGAKLPYTSVNGHMFRFLGVDGTLALRLPPAEREAFLARFGARLHEAHGTTMKEYVTVPDAIVEDVDALVPYLRAGHAWVAGMKPKPTKRRRP
jgi:hypothetical protein